MSTTVKAVLRGSKRRADGTAPVWIRVTANRKSRFISTGIYVEPKFWNQTRAEFRKSHPIAPALNARLQSLVLEARKEALEAKSAQEVKSALKGVSGSLTAYLEAYVAELDTAGKFWERKKYATTLRKVRACLGDDVDWDEVDRTALIRLERYLRQEVGNNPNTVRKEFVRLQRVFKNAIRDGQLAPEQNPFLYYDKPKGQKVNRRKLSLKEIHALEAVELKDDTWLALARDAFIFAFYGSGMRFGDVCRLRQEYIQSGRLDYRMMKTNTPVSVPLPSPALNIVEKYRQDEGGLLFPFLRDRDITTPVKLRRHISSCNTLTNKYLKQAAIRADLDPDGLSMHVARHSFADYARTKSGNLYAISKTLGHSSLQITQTYLKSFDRDAVDQLAEELWS